MRCIIWKILYFWNDNVKCTIVGMFVMKWLHTAPWGGHNYAFVAGVVVRNMIIIIIIVNSDFRIILLPGIFKLTSVNGETSMSVVVLINF